MGYFIKIFRAKPKYHSCGFKLIHCREIFLSLVQVQDNEMNQVFLPFREG